MQLSTLACEPEDQCLKNGRIFSHCLHVKVCQEANKPDILDTRRALLFSACQEGTRADVTLFWDGRPAPSWVLSLTWGFHVILLNVRHVRIQGAFEIVEDNFPAEVVPQAHQKDGQAAGHEQGLGHNKAYYCGDKGEK